MKKLIMKIVVRLVIFVAITAVLTAIKESAVITNDIAIGQLENSDGAYIAMQSVRHMNSIVSIVYVAFSALLFWPVIDDIYKFIKAKNH